MYDLDILFGGVWLKEMELVFKEMIVFLILLLYCFYQLNIELGQKVINRWMDNEGVLSMY